MSVLLSTASDASSEMRWSEEFAGVGFNGYASGIASWNGSLVFGGLFSRQGAIACKNVALFDENTWQALGAPGFFEFTAFGILDGVLYAHGYWGNFTAPDFLVRWNGASWENAAGIPDGVVLRAMAAYQGELFLGASNYFATFDGLSLGAPGPNPPQREIQSMVVLDNTLYVGGHFGSLEDGTPAHGLARWDGSAWSTVEGRAALGGALVEGLHGSPWPVDALAVHQGQLVVAGDFTHAGELPVRNIVLWDPTTQLWSAIGSGVGAGVYALASDGTNLYVGGNLDEAGGQSVTNLAAWDGSGWSSVGTGTEGPVYDLLFDAGRLAIAGNFRSAGGIQAKGMALWDGTQFSSPSGPSGLGFDGFPSIVLPFGDGFVVTGNFTYAGQTRVNNVASWTGAGWTDLDGGLDGRVGEAMIHDGNLVVAGDFTTAGGVDAPYLASWNGSEWFSIGDALPGAPTALTVHDGQIYAAGNPPEFIPPYLKRFDPASGWGDVPLEPGVVFVHALGSYQDDLFIGANVNQFYGPASENARFDGVSWQPLVGQQGGSLDSGAQRFITMGGLLHVLGESFTFDGAWSETKVGTWDGMDLLPLQPASGNIGLIVRSTAVLDLGGTTYLAAFPERGGNSLWRAPPGASSWEMVGHHTGGGISDLMEFQGKLLVAGSFDGITLATGMDVAAAGFTWLEPAATPAPESRVGLAQLQKPRPNPFNPATVIRYSIPPNGAVGSLAVYNLRGQRVRLLHEGFFSPGEHRAVWDGFDDDRQAQPSGVYLIRLQTDLGVTVQKGTLVR
jgi:hypothetical protein